MTPQKKSYSLLFYSKRIHLLAITILAVAFPWILFPVGFEFYESAKSIFLLIVVISLAVAWAMRVVAIHKIEIIKTPFNYVVIAWVAVNILSTVLSIDPTTSAWGFSSRMTGGLFTTIAFGLLYFFIVNSNDEYKDYALPTRGLNYSITLFSLVIIGQYLNGYFGILNSVYDNLAASFNLVNSSFLKSISFSTIGASSLIPFVLLVLFPVISNRYFAENSRFSLFSSIISVVSISIAASSLGGIYQIIIPLFFFLLIGVYISFYIEKRGELVPKATLITLVFIVSFFIFNLNYSRQIGIKGYTVNPPLAVEESLLIATKTMSESPKNIVIGSGPDTFVLFFTKHHSEKYADSDFWDVRYTRSGSQVIENFQNLGLIGGITWFALFAALFLFVRKNIFNSKVGNTKVDISLLGISVVPILIFVASFFTFFNIALLIIFWLSVSIMIGGFFQLNPELKKVWRLDLSVSDESIELVPQFIFSLTIIASVVLVYIFARSFIADVNLRFAVNNSVKAFIAKEQEDQTLECNFHKAAFNNSSNAYSVSGFKEYVARYHALISYNFGTYLFNLQEKETINEVCPDTQGAFFYLATAETVLRGDPESGISGLLSRNRSNIENHEAATKVFSGLVGMIPDFNEKYSTDTSNSLLESISLDPYNPNHWLNLGILIYSSSERIAQEDETKAIDLIERANDYFKRAYDLRPTYLRTILVITQANLLYSRETEAIAFLNETAKSFDRNSQEYNKLREWIDLIERLGVVPTDTTVQEGQGGDITQPQGNLNPNTSQ